MRCYKVIDNGTNTGPKARYQIELYHFHPEVGPEHTFGRGPYCIGRSRIKSEALAEAKAQLAVMGAIDLDTALQTHT